MDPAPTRLLSAIGSNGDVAFPWKLHIVLEESERCGFEDIISWQAKNAFKIHDPRRFEASVMKEYFNNTKYKSFQRQINIYGFKRVSVGDGGIVGSYTHSLFVRGKPSMCRFMVRTKIKKRGVRRNVSKPSNKLAPKSNSRSEIACTNNPCTTLHSKIHSDMSRSMIDEGRLSVPFQDRMRMCDDENSRSGSPLERLLFNANENVQSIYNHDSSADATISCNVGLSRPSQFDLQTEMFFNGSMHDIINDSSQSSTDDDVSTMTEESGFLSSAQDIIAPKPLEIDVCVGMFQNQRGQHIAYLQAQQHNNLSEDHQRLVDLRQQQVKLQQEDYKLLKLQTEILSSQFSTLSCCEELHVQSNESHSNNQDDFWKCIGNMDLNPTPIFMGSKERFNNNDFVNTIEISDLV